MSIPTNPRSNRSNEGRQRLQQPTQGGLPIPTPYSGSQSSPELPSQTPPTQASQGTTPAQAPVSREVEYGERLDWKVDPKTGKKYRPLPKTKEGPDGRPAIAVNDFNLDDMTGEADIFLAHLRVPPTQEELDRWAEARRLKDEKEARLLIEEDE